PGLQGDIPPFRDSYQTSTFFATMLALHRFVHGSDLLHPNADQQAGLQWTASPRLFVIGRSQEFDVTPTAPRPGDPSLDNADRDRTRSRLARCDFDHDCYSISATRHSWFWSEDFMWAKRLAVGVGLAALSLAAAALAIGTRGLVGVSRTHFTSLVQDG